MTETSSPSGSSIDVSIVIPTFRRNHGLNDAVNSVLAMTDTSLSNAEIVIVDNSPEAGAKETATKLQSISRIPISYVSEPNPGVANARNAGLEKAKSRIIAFIDDDETARNGWLDGLLSAHKLLNPAVVFGPVETVLPPEAPKAHKAYLEQFFSRRGPEETILIEEPFGCGNALLDLDKIQPCLPAGEPFFNKIANETGGEDDYLFARVSQAGQTFAWAHNAVVDENVPAKRAHLGYTLRRGFAYGQGPSTNCWRNNERLDILGLIFWMIIGAGQFAVFGTAALAMFIIRHPRRAFMIDKAIRGLGKVLWFPPFILQFYGDVPEKKKKQKQQPA
ncbi:glycosyltransferase family 2 protein [Hirschia litorea]|uniref:Glycosyltransferase family 2 protein n=1 Tax=Hirschia litorea TaxID=1199156 RepID=A0ABW2IGW0_9PROT